MLKPLSYIFSSLLLVLAFYPSVLLAETLVLGVAPSAEAPFPRYEEVLNNANSKVLKTYSSYRKLPPLKTKAQAWKETSIYLSGQTGLNIVSDLPTSQLQFERKLALGEYALVYLSPLQFVTARNHLGFQALAKRKAQPVRGLLLVSQDNQSKTLRDVKQEILSLPGLLDFASSIAPRFSLDRLNFSFPLYLKLSESEIVAKLVTGEINFGSVSEHHYLSLDPATQKKIKILWETPGYTPFALAANPNVPFYSVSKLQRALISMGKKAQGKNLLPYLQVNNGFEIARNSDWHDIEQIDIDMLNNNLQVVDHSTPEQAK